MRAGTEQGGRVCGSGAGAGSRRHARRAPRRALVAGLGVLALLTATPTLAGATPSAGRDAGAGHPASSVDGSGRRVVAARAAVPAGARALGAVGSAQVVDGAVALRPRDPAALQAYATAVSTPGSTEHGRYLAPGAFAARFGPTPGTIRAVEHQLVSSGLAVTAVASDGLLVHFRAPAPRVAAAFGTTLERYRLADGRPAYAPTSALTLPATVASSVQAVLGLSDVLAAHSDLAPADAPRQGGAGHRAALVPVTPASAPAGAPVACPDATAAAQAYGGLTDTQIGNSYGTTGLYRAGDLGAGQTVAIFELEPFATSDIAAFDACYFGAKAAASMLSRLTTTAVDGGQQVGPGSGEAELDVEDVSATAPGARIDVYEAPNDDLGTVDNYATIVDADTAKVLSTSWGFCEQPLQDAYPGTQQVENTLFEQAAVQGQSVFAAAGDAGSDDCAEQGPKTAAPYLSVDDPESQPFVTSAGGLTITDASRPPEEQVWNDGPDGGAGGGGESDTWTEPSWQADSRVPGINNKTVLAAAAKASGAPAGAAFCDASAYYASVSTGCREVPDVSAQADEFTGAVTVLYAGEWTTFGGTSSAAPLWAGMLALVNASATCTADPATSTGVGFANPSLYALASVPAEYAASFTDVTAGDNDAFGISGGLYPATTGYDMASGLGSPELTSPSGGRGLAYYLCATAAATRPAVTAVTPPALDAPGHIEITGQGFESPSGADLVAGVQIGAVGVAPDEVVVRSATEIDLTITGFQPLAGNGGTDQGFIADGNGTYDVSVTLVGGLTSAPDAAGRLTLYGINGGTPAGSPEVDGVGASAGGLAGGGTVTLYGSGFTGATAVTFGGVAATITDRVSDSELRVTVPPFDAGSGGTICAQAADTADEICQVTVRVTNSAGTSPVGRILAPYSGAYALNADDVPVVPADCNCEIAPAATEYDYIDAPTITSVASRPMGANGVHYAGERGGTIETIDGTGLGILGLEWLDIGPTNLAASEDVNFHYESATEIQVALPPIASTSSVQSVTVHVQTLASPNVGDLSSSAAPSTPGTVLYAPSSTVTSVRTDGPLSAGPSSGGTALTIRGTGFAGANRVAFVDEAGEFSSASTTDVTVVSDTEIRVTTPPTNPGTDDVVVCGATDCSPRHHQADTFVFYAPGAPHVTSISRHDGPAGGGTTVVIHGANLGYAVSVLFGSKVAAIVPGSALLDEGSTTTVVVTSPPGPAGSTVAVRVATIESEATGTAPSPATAATRFRYLPAPASRRR
jgi:hypothetical protein